MAVPDFQSLMLPLLKLATDGQSHSLAEARDALATQFGLKRAKKGVFISTGSFSAEAVAYVEHIDPKVVLIDGKRLAQLMIDFEVGIATSRTYQVKRVDSDYFEEV